MYLNRIAAIFILALGLCSPSRALAEPVVVVGTEQAQAFLIGHNGQCYAVLPDHVTSRSRLSLVSAYPERQGDATMTPLRFPAMDLALAHVSGPLARDCEPQWPDIPDSLARVLRRDASGEVIRVRRGGIMERLPVIVTEVGYETVTVAPTSSQGGRFGKGTSGSLLMVGATAVGIAINTASGKDAVFLRLDAIKARLSRFIEDRQIYAASGQVPGAVDQSGEGLAFSVSDWNLTPLDSQFSPENLADGSGPFVVPPMEREIRLVLDLASDAAVPVSSIAITTDTADAAFSPPKAIAVLVDASATGNGNPRLFVSGEMGPDGGFQRKRAATYARRVIVSVRSAWYPDRPMRIDSIRIE